jgi:hypothetical protein
MVGLTLVCQNALAVTGLPTACLSCHDYQREDFSPMHPFAYAGCTVCHGGDAQAQTLPQAHKDMIARPGDLRNEPDLCAGCHPRQMQQVTHSLMNTARGLVRKTREALGEGDHPRIQEGLDSLGHSAADSMIRKLCASCHLSHPLDRTETDVTLLRGGGCSACHIDRRQSGEHPRLTARVGDGRCFGCHSRSGRISLNYVGLAEIEQPTEASVSETALFLTDGRAVRQVSKDLHYLAGMSCIDCHTGSGVMGRGDNTGFKQQAVDIQCMDCHAAPVRVVSLQRWPAEFPELRRYLEGLKLADRQMPVTRHRGTPLWHIEVRADGSRLLHPKQGGAPLTIPDYRTTEHLHAEEHRRLACATCHSQWAPQCYGCHSQYEPEGRQWDHLLQQQTPGRWRETRWDVRAQLPSLGVDGQGRIRPVTPGMIMQVEHPAWDEPLFRRLFGLSEPHTTGRARTCESCHRTPQALGLGEGVLSKQGGEWHFQPAKGRLQDGLPSDAWTSLDGSLRGQASDGVSRPFTAEEMRRILDVELSQSLHRKAQQPSSRGGRPAPAAGASGGVKGLTGCTGEGSSLTVRSPGSAK